MAAQFPSSPSVNQQYSFSNKTWIWSGNTWDLVSLSVLAVSPTEPVTPSIGALWLNTTTNNLTIYNGSLFIAPNVANLVLKANITDLTTANVAELTNLYFTNARVYAAVTGNLALKANVTDLTTSNVTELTNLYFTNARSRTAISVTGSGSYDNSTGVITISGGGGSTYGDSNVALLGYATNANVALKANVADLTTANVTEITNLYFTNARVYSNATQLGYITAGSLSGYATNSQLTSYATTAYVGNELANLVASAPASLDTLNELAAALGNDNNFSTTVLNYIGTKANTSSLTTANVVELTNLYFTNARVYSAVTGNLALKSNVADLTTANVTELTNLYFTNARVYSNVTQLGYATNANVALKANVVDLTTANVSELTNLYFTNARVYSNVTQLGYATTANSLSQFASTNSLQLFTLISDETGTGNLVFSTSPVLVTPNLGTPSAITLTSATGLPISTGVSGLGANQTTLLAANAQSGVTANTYGGALSVPVITVDVYGRITSASNVAITTGVSSVGGATGAVSNAQVASAVSQATISNVTVSGNVIAGNVAISTSGVIKFADGTYQSTAYYIPRLIVVADNTSVTINANITDIAEQVNTQVAGTLTINAPTGTLADGQKLIFRLQSANVQTFSWNSAFVGSTDLALPTVSTGSSKYDYTGFIYNSTATKWQLLAKNFGF